MLVECQPCASPHWRLGSYAMSRRAQAWGGAIIWWRETGHKHANKQMYNKLMNGMIISDEGMRESCRTWAERQSGTETRGAHWQWRGTRILVQCQGWKLEGVKQERDISWFIERSHSLLCGEWASEGSRWKMRQKAQLRAWCHLGQRWQGWRDTRYVGRGVELDITGFSPGDKEGKESLRPQLGPSVTEWILVSLC